MTRWRSIIPTLFLLICWLSFRTPQVQAAPTDGTQHTGPLTGDETWTATGNPHYVNGTVTIPAGITLTIQPGVVVRSLTDYYFGGFIVNGVLNADGAADNKIIFTSKDDSAPAQWGAVKVLGGTANLSHVEVRYGGGGGYGIACFNASATVCVQGGGSLSINDGYFHANAPDNDFWSGVLTAYSANASDPISLSVTNSRFEANGNAAYGAYYYPIVLDGPGINLTMAGNTFTDNQVNRVLLLENPMKNQAAITLPAQSGLEAYELGSTWTIPASQTLTLQPGVTLKARPGWPPGNGTPLVVEGTLLALGSDAQKITLDATNPTIGWGGLVVRGAAGLARLDHAQILRGGAYCVLNNTGYISNVVVEDGARLEMSNSRVADLVYATSDPSFGVIKLKDGSAVLTGNTIANNVPAGATGGLYAMRIFGPQSRLEMVDNTFSGNFINAVLLGSDGLAATTNTLRPQTGLLGYDFGTPYADHTYIQQPTGQLTLEAGTHLRGVTGPWGKGIYFEVRGSLNAMGTAEAPVVFDSSIANAPASWGGIYINGGTAELSQTRIVNGGRGNDYPTPGPFPSLWVAAGGRLSLFDSTIADNRTSGQPDLGVLVDNASVSLVRSTFSGLGNPGEADYPLKVSGADSRLILRDNTFTGNASDRAQLASNSLTGADFTLIPQNGLSGYELVNTLTVPDGITMTVSPGVSLYGRSGAGLVVKGRLNAERNSGQPILFTSLSDSSAHQWSGVIFDGSSASGSLEGVTLRYGGSILAGGSSYPQGGLVFYNLAPDTVQVRRCAISFGYKAGWQIFNSSTLLPATLDGNLISAASSGPGLRLSGTSQVVLANTAILDNDSGGANLDASGTQLTLLHPTLARNKVYGLRAVTGASATLNNAIFARNAVALRAETGGAVTSDTALWDANTVDTAGSGTINILNRINGAAAFDPGDGYHITQYSEATSKGKAAILADDVDGSIRPQPAGGQPDLGADEINQTTNLTLTAEKLALPQVWVNRPDASSNPSGALLQQYWIRFKYGSADSQATPLTVSVQDTLPSEFTFQGEEHTPRMTFNGNGQELNWQTTDPLPAQGTVDIQISTQADNPTAGSTITNQAVVTAGSVPFNLSASTLVPVVTPLVTWPADGELCAQPDHALSVEGSAQPGATIEIYEGATFKGQSVVDEKGLFKVTYSDSQAGLSSLLLRARACTGGTCSGFTQINLAIPLSFWDPQRSWWEGDPIVGPMAGKHVTFKFRDQEGLASSTSWIIPGVYGFSDTTLHLYACQDAATSKMPTQIWITADAHVYIPIAVDGPMYTYKIGSAHRVDMQATYREDPPPDPPDPNDPPPPPPPGYPPEPKIIHDREVWIDPDGYVFNSTLGFDPLDPTQHVIPGARVTCMVLLPGWGGWVAWPAHLYGGQINPQVVGSNGYFAFFTPPGQYYIQVDGPSGYQSYRSPVVTVVNEIVHVNIPLTPAVSESSPIFTLQSSRGGFSQAELAVPVGAWVRWEIIQSMQEDPASLLADITNPMLRLLSSPDPFASTSGWDSGRLYPSQVYTRQFPLPGNYTYTDSNGHTAIIHVGTSRLFLPLIRR